MTAIQSREGGRLDLWAEFALLACVLVIATALRLHDIGVPNLWADEGNNAYFADQTLPDLVRMCRLTQDTDPPAHRLALRLWLAVVGDGALQMRALSVLCNLLTIVAIWWWARRVSGPTAGLIAAVVFCLHPLAILYGREAKGYPFATLFCTIQCAIWVEAIRGKRPPRPWAWLAATLCATLAIGSHYYVVLSFVAQGAALLGWWFIGRRQGHDGAPRRIFIAWTASCAVACAALAPWVILTYGPARQAALELRPEHDTWTLTQALAEIGLSLAGGKGPRNLYRLPALVGLGGLACASFLRARKACWFPALLVAAPIALAALLQLLIPFFSVRFLYYVLAPLSVLAGLGWKSLGGTKWALLGATAISWALCLPLAYNATGQQDQDLRPIATSLSELAEPSDTVLVGYIWQAGILGQYAPDLEIDYALAWYTPETVEDSLEALLTRNDRLWLLSYRVPTQHSANLPGGWLAGNTTRAWRMRHEAHTLALFMSPMAPEGRGVDMAWGRIRATAWPPQSGAVRPGDWVTLPIAWTVDERPLQPTVAFLHLVDDQGGLAAQQDGAPQNGVRLFRAMQPGETVQETRVVRIPDDATPGEYHLLMGLYWPQTGQRLAPLAGNVRGDDAVGLGSVNVAGD